MSYKDLLVVLGSDAASRERMGLAVALAERFAAHLVGLYPLPVPDAPRHLGYYDPALLDPFFRELREKAQEVGDKEREAFEHAAGLAVFRQSGAWLKRMQNPTPRCTRAMSI